ncbi:MAG: MBL fold metallo-hydrolase [Actinomycetota bacterium]|nr:MBL fold metallo-hydrolase [Actinomycetota bacterium]
MLTIELFPAKFGDAILLTYGPPGKESHVLVDAGLKGVGKTVAKRLAQRGVFIDLFVVTHVDIDHIGGAVSLLNTPSFTDRLGAVWFNGFKHLDQFSDLLGPIDGERLTSRLVELDVPWNVGWPWNDGSAADHVGGPVVARTKPVKMPLPGTASALLLSPTPQKLANLLPEWEKVVKAAGLELGVTGRHEPKPAPEPGNDMLGGPTLKELAAADTDDDTAPANGSSIAFVFEVKDGGRRKRVLLGGDAHPQVLVDGLRQVAKNGAKYAVDACKLPHHGSRANVTTALVQLLDCPQWLVSTNGSQFSHPNAEALARCVVHGSPGATLVFNYESTIVQQFLADHPPHASGYTAVLPAAGEEGIVVTL